MSWNYRVVRCIEPDQSQYYEIREAYYASVNDTHPHSITERPARPGGETLLSLRRDVALMLAAFDKGPLDARQFDGQDPAVPLQEACSRAGEDK